MLTEDEIGKEQFEKAKNDRARFRGVPGAALQYARERGIEAARRMDWITARPDDYTEAEKNSIENDIQTFTRQAFRGWRAYRIMKG